MHLFNYRLYYFIDPTDAFPSVWHVSASRIAEALEKFATLYPDYTVYYLEADRNLDSPHLV